MKTFIKSISILLILQFISKIGYSEDNKSVTEYSNKGRTYILWGWNRSWYTDSDIHFTGEGYDFTLSQVKAYDRQTPFGFDPYFNIGRITIPQTNFRIGYFINDKLDISFGYDHMKYVMKNYLTNKISGYIHTGNKYDGSYQNDDIVLLGDFLTFEHTDGLNYFNLEITRNDNLLKLFKLNHNQNKIKLNTLVGFGGGFMLPRSNVQLLFGKRYDEFHLAGYGISVKTGLDLIIYKYFFLRGELRGGFIDMPSIRSSPDPKDNASQHFFFFQPNFCFGFNYYFLK